MDDDEDDEEDEDDDEEEEEDQFEEDDDDDSDGGGGGGRRKGKGKGKGKGRASASGGSSSMVRRTSGGGGGKVDKVLEEVRQLMLRSRKENAPNPTLAELGITTVREVSDMAPEKVLFEIEKLIVEVAQSILKVIAHTHTHHIRVFQNVTCISKKNHGY